jgi:serine/threonine protein phosphatase 1
MLVPEEHLKWIERLPLVHVDKHRTFVHAGVDPNCSLDEQDQQDLIWKIYDDRDEGGHGHCHIVHGHHQHARGPILKKNRTNLDTFAWYTGRLVIAVFDDATPGGPLDILDVQGEPIEAIEKPGDWPVR